MDKKIELFTWSYCPFCVKAKELLDSKGYEYDEVVLDTNDVRRQELIERTGQESVPYVFIDYVLIGGYDDLKKLDDEGKL